MIIKPRYESKELKLLRSLHKRMHLCESDLNYYFNLEKGFKGEQQFDLWIERWMNEYIILNDLLFDCNNTIFQIDTLLISEETLYLFEIKNYEGDFYIKGGRWHTISGSEIKNPLLQIERSEPLLRRLLQDLKINIPIKSYLIFINPDFHLYQASPNQPIIFPTQLNRFMKKFNMESSKLIDRHTKLANQLTSIHLEKSPYTRIPHFEYDQLKKGILCLKCNSFVDGSLVCKSCGHKEDITTAVLRSAAEYKLLFPERRITTNAIHAWCNVIKSKKTIHRILSGNFKVNGRRRGTYYT